MFVVQFHLLTNHPRENSPLTRSGQRNERSRASSLQVKWQHSGKVLATTFCCPLPKKAQFTRVMGGITSKSSRGPVEVCLIHWVLWWVLHTGQQERCWLLIEWTKIRWDKVPYTGLFRCFKCIKHSLSCPQRPFLKCHITPHTFPNLFSLLNLTSTRSLSSFQDEGLF